MGTGGDFAVGVLHALLPDGTKDINEARIAVKTALTVAARLDAASGPPFTLFNQHRPV
jgi:ATP-dependent protease HslVU (ClpYQ) peptidase subunit